MRKINQKIVVVLGMHRSGTSAVTRGLQVIGIELGDRLMMPVKGDNDKLVDECLAKLIGEHLAAAVPPSETLCYSRIELSRPLPVPPK